jgi:carbon-monoxide dehydrogenase medium subunit
MKPDQFTYHCPKTIDEVIFILNKYPDSKLLAGGQSLMPMLNMRIVTPANVIDLNRVRGLDGIKERNGEVVIGAMTRQRDIEFSATVHERLPLLADAITWTGHRQTRNRGTIGGSICHLDPSAEQPSIAVAMDAQLEIVGPHGLRSIPMLEFGSTLMTNILMPNELLTAIRFKPWAIGHGWAFTEFARRHGDYAIVSASALIELDKTGCASRVSLTLGGVAAMPMRIKAAEERLLGTKLEAADVDAASVLCQDIDALDDPQIPKWYRQQLARTLVGRVLPTALSRAEAPHQ